MERKTEAIFVVPSQKVQFSITYKVSQKTVPLDNFIEVSQAVN